MCSDRNSPAPEHAVGLCARGYDAFSYNSRQTRGRNEGKSQDRLGWNSRNEGPGPAGVGGHCLAHPCLFISSSQTGPLAYPFHPPCNLQASKWRHRESKRLDQVVEWSWLWLPFNGLVSAIFPQYQINSFSELQGPQGKVSGPWIEVHAHTTPKRD